MKVIQNIGAVLFIISLLIFIGMLGLGKQVLTLEYIPGETEYHKNAIAEQAQNAGILNVGMGNIEFVSEFKKVLIQAQKSQENLASSNLPEGVSEWDFKLGNWKISDYLGSAVKSSATGPVQNNPWLFFCLTFGLAVLGGLLFIAPKFLENPGIKHNGIYHDSLTRGLKFDIRTGFLILTIIGVIVYGFVREGNLFWPIVTLVIAGLISYFVFFREGSKDNNPQRSASPIHTGWLGVITGFILIGFYILLYWKSEYITNWVSMVSPLSIKLNGGEASRWFLYGLMYTIIMVVMGVRMLAKYQHNKYQRVRTYSVMFFQTAFAFLIPQILEKFNKPAPDLKNMWPLDYSFFFDYRLDELASNGTLGIFMLVWGIALFVIGVPVFVFFFGKRWYCSWVCGCGGLAETMGDPFRQLSDKSMRAWKYERYIIHGVLVAAILMTIGVLYTYFTGSYSIGFINTDSLKSWYGFFIGAGFAGIVGTGFYPLMGNRMWCRFGCPLAGYLGLIQRFRSKFRITTNGGQCISCGNCSTYCEMGIDVRSYAQKGQNIVRSSCVGCGVCAAVCPRGVLRLENGTDTGSSRTEELKTIHISEGQVKILVD
jgi:Pyruvate/2-oxoacid:ferredoxin oxidoreductase delta subunit